MRARFAGPLLTDWREVEYLMSDSPTVRLRTRPHRSSASCARSSSRASSPGLSKQEGAEVLASLDEEQAADTLEELSTEQQAQLLSAMPVEQAADLIEEMEPDEAADVLAKVPAPRARRSCSKRWTRPSRTAVRQLLRVRPATAPAAS